jgi:hypothetical protein
VSSFAFLVEGHLEKKFIQNICPNKTVRMLNCNGKQVSAQAIAKRVATQCRLFKGRYSTIIICVDREDRVESASKFRDNLLKAIKSENVIENIIIGIPDRMIENWILADKATVYKFTSKRPIYEGNSDGFNGKSVIRHLIPEYHETTVGVELLEKCRVSKMLSSESFKDFYGRLPKGICWWLER